MKLLDLLELALKSDEVIDVLEHYELQVMYDFDRLHENTADAYWAASTEAGFQLRFDEKQVLDTIFMYAQSRGKFSAIDRSVAGIPFYSSFAEASAAFREREIPVRRSPEGEGWIKGRFGGHWIHYEFNPEGSLSLVTVMAGDA